MILDAFSLQGKVAVVTGCDTGLGQGMAVGLAEAGCDIVGINIVEPQETRHIVMHNEQAVISPSWSIHSGVGSKAYTVIWGMVGENQVFDDMDHVAVKDLR